MIEPDAKQLELQLLMQQNLEHLEKRTFGWVDQQECREQEARLRRIAELSADLAGSKGLAA
jgi:hypothetical protein